MQVLSEIPAVAISRWKCPEIEPRERKTAEIEGWILGVLKRPKGARRTSRVKIESGSWRDVYWGQVVPPA